MPNMVYHGYAGLNNNHQTHNTWRGSLAYVTGTHSMKVGYQAAYKVTDVFGDFATHGLQYRVNVGVPNENRAAHHEMAAGQSHALGRVLCAGSVDPQQVDVAGRAALRARVELLPRRG